MGSDVGTCGICGVELEDWRDIELLNDRIDCGGDCLRCVREAEEKPMPNWCSNRLVVEGTDGAVIAWHDKHTKVVTHQRPGDKTEDTLDLDFNAAVERPKVFDDIATGHTVIDGEACKIWRRVDEVKGDPTSGTNVKISDEELKAIEAEHGASNWYDWCIRNWGTKWNAGESRISVLTGKVIVEFETAWGPPHAWLETMSGQHPDLEFALTWCEPGCDGYGVLRAKNGELSDEGGDRETIYTECGFGNCLEDEDDD